MFVSELSQEWIITAMVALIALGFLIAIVKLRSGSKLKFEGVQRKSRLFSVSERKFFESLSDALDYDYHIFAKVGVLEVIGKSAGMSKRRYRRLEQQLQSERFDYVVCRKTDLSVSAVIELECFDRRLPKGLKQKRNALISELCKASKLRLFYFDTRQDYLGMDIRRLITGSSKCATKKDDQKVSAISRSGLSKKSLEMSEYAESASMVTEDLGHNKCPQCHSDLVTKVAVKGKHIGERFIICRKYPYCDYRLLLNDPNVVNIRSATAQATEIRKGFSDWSGQ